MNSGEMILIDYIGKTDGEIFDLSVEEKAEEEGIRREEVDYEPIPVLLGEGYVIEGLEDALMEMDVGEEKELEISPDRAYGQRDSDNVETYPEKEFKQQGVQVQPGEEIMIGNRRGKVVSRGSGRVRVDFNHPLAGKDLEYWVKIVEEVEDDREKANYIYRYHVSDEELEFEDGTVVAPAEYGHEDHTHELPEEVKERVREQILEYTDFEEVRFE